MTELDFDFLESLTQAALLSIPVWLATITARTEKRRWLYQIPLVVPVVGVLLSYVSIWLIVAFLVQLLILDLVTFWHTPGARPPKAPIVCITRLPPELERRSRCRS